jgi:hypothetical protein
LSEYSKTFVYDEQGQTTERDNIGLSVEASATGAKGGFNLEMKSGDEEITKRNTTVKTIYKGLQVINYKAIRAELEMLVTLCGAKAFIILIDEWSSVRKAIQPFIAEMMRHTG